MLVIEGNLTWIIPLLLIIATAAITLYTIYPITEYLVESFNEEIKKDEDKEEDNEEDKDEDKDEDKKGMKKMGVETKSDKKEVNIQSLDKLIKKLKNELKRLEKQREILIKEKKVEEKEVKEKFMSFDNSAEILEQNWRESNLPSTLKKYKGPIQGYNCGNYSEFTYGKGRSCPSLSKFKPNSSNRLLDNSSSNDYIFPGRKQNKTGVIKYANRPHLLEHENDVNEKILEYESSAVFPKQKVEDIQYLHNPQYMYHRRSGKLDSEITDDNRFEVGALNVFKLPTKQYSVM